ncbi:GDSL-type esterase/lipase family protein [Nocardioides sp. J54]|uniref:GDSL-type esterase/lipase family protein n=1 Tax=Nocardioides sp. J54 TaxID=935866 RepID=UPI0004B3E2AF|nr:GDSL-type esterase/lipase family protein [Nocardioides sp. J54]
MRRILTSLLVPLLAAPLAAVTTAAPARAYDVPEPGIRNYVALGDSFTAGPLVPFFADVPCVRSTNNYPSTLAVKLGIYDTGFRDVSCSAADTTAMEGRFAPPAGLGTTVAPQLDALRPDTDLVTIGIGGNDESFFGTIIGECPDLASADPDGNPCQRKFTVDGVDTLAAIIPRTGARVARVLEAIRERSPRARVVYVGPLRLLPANGIPCPDVPLARGDIAWADGLLRKLNEAMARVAARQGVEFVDVYGASLGHDACAGDDAWVQGGWVNLFKAVSWHPLRSGMDAVAQMVHEKLNGKDLAAGRLVTASSTESGLAPSRAIDRDPYARWASYHWRDGEWLAVDLGSRQTVRRLELNWEDAWARAYRVEVSDDGRTWRTVWSTINSDGGHDTVRFPATTARHVRVVGVTRATWYGISLWDLEVYRT